MMKAVTVTEGTSGDLPKAVSSVTAVDFGFDSVPDLKAGTSVVRLDNRGKQIHELLLVGIPKGKSIDDLVSWAATEAGPPPVSVLQGVAVKAGENGTGEYTLEKGSTYAFVCIIPDFLGDMKPHITKGMRTAPFTVA